MKLFLCSHFSSVGSLIKEEIENKKVAFIPRFADQRWLIYDVKRQYGYYYNLTEMEEVTFEDPRQAHLVTWLLL